MSARVPHHWHDHLNPEPAKELVFKFLVIGDFGVGKTAIVRRFTKGQFSSNYKITIGADFSVKSIEWDKNTVISLQLWDIAGHERFGYVTRIYYKNAIACAIVFDVTRFSTFVSVKRWLSDLREKVVSEDGTNLPVILMANKWDIDEPCISSDFITKFCRENQISDWFQVSAKENLNIDRAMNKLVEEALKKVPNSGITLRETDTVTLGDANKTKFHCCN